MSARDIDATIRRALEAGSPKLLEIASGQPAKVPNGIAGSDKTISSVEEIPSVWSIEVRSQGWLVDGLVPSEAVTLLTGASGIGKSMVALALGGSVVWGASFLGRRCLQRPVLFLDRENPHSVIRDRLDLFGIKCHQDLRYWGMWLGQEPPDPGGAVVQSFAQKKPLIAIDSLVAFHGGSEQDATETRAFMHRLRRLAAAGATVVVLHHTGKGETTKDYRGSSDIAAAVDAAFVVERGEGASGIERLTLRNFKMRCSESPARLSLEFRDGRFEAGTDPFVKETLRGRDTLRGIVAASPGIGRTAAVNALTGGGIARSRARSLVDAAVADGEIVTTRGGRGGAETLRLADVLELEL
jgi:AAA domain